MDIITGSHVGSRDFTTIKAELSHRDPTHFEAAITALFTPWIVTEVPDGAWQTLQEKLSSIVRDMLSGRKERNK